MDCTYDNTTGNLLIRTARQKGYSPGDMTSTNEMMTLLLIYVTYRDGDEELGILSPDNTAR